MSEDSLEYKPEDASVDINSFWGLVDDLLYTKVYYNQDSNLYYTKRDGHLCTDDQLKQSIDNDEYELEIATDRINLRNGQDVVGGFEVCNEDEINTLLVNFIALVAKYSDQLIAQVGEEEFLSAIAEYLMKFKYYQNHVEFCARKMLALLVYSVDSNLNNLSLDVDQLEALVRDEVNESIETNEKYIKIIGWIFHEHYVYYPRELLETLKEYRGFTALGKVVKNYIAISKTVGDGIDIYGEAYKNYLELWFELCKSYQFTDELDVIEEEDVLYIFERLKIESRNENETNFLKFRMLLILNEQFMFESGLNIYIGEATNLIFDAMLKNIKYFQVFSDILILNFNREMDVVDQILMMKFLYVVFSNEMTNRLVYLNDIKVIIDIIIRQLYDLQLDQYEYLVNIYLRVLHTMLVETELINHDYKKDELFQVLEYVRGNEASSEKSQKLAIKCIQCAFFEGDPRGCASGETLPNIGSLRVYPEGSKSASCSDLTEHKLVKNILSIPGHLISVESFARTPGGTHVISPRKVAHSLHLDNGTFDITKLPPHLGFRNHRHHAKVHSPPPLPPPKRAYPPRDGKASPGASGHAHSVSGGTLARGQPRRGRGAAPIGARGASRQAAGPLPPPPPPPRDSRQNSVDGARPAPCPPPSRLTRHQSYDNLGRGDSRNTSSNLSSTPNLAMTRASPAAHGNHTAPPAPPPPRVRSRRGSGIPLTEHANRSDPELQRHHRRGGEGPAPRNTYPTGRGGPSASPETCSVSASTLPAPTTEPFRVGSTSNLSYASVDSTGSEDSLRTRSKPPPPPPPPLQAKRLDAEGSLCGLPS